MLFNNNIRSQKATDIQRVKFHNAVKALVKPSPPKAKLSSVARYKLFRRTLPGTYGYSNNTGASLSNGNSYALAYIWSHGWYSKAGCCQSIRDLSTKKIRYYIPDTHDLSIKKKIKYIKELAQLIPDRITIIGLHEGDTFTIPTTGKSVDSIHNTGGDGLGTIPYRFSMAKKWLMVDVVIKEQYDNLFFLQLLRPLYQSGQVNYNHYPHTGHQVLYNQPRLYLKLQKLFPKLTRYQLLYLSHTIHGGALNNTYFGISHFRNGYREFWINDDWKTSKENLNITSSLQNHRSTDRIAHGVYLPYNSAVSYTVETNYFTDNKRDKILGNKKLQLADLQFKAYTQRDYDYGVYDATHKILGDLCFTESKHNYTEAIKLISKVIDDPTLIENIK